MKVFNILSFSLAESLTQFLGVSSLTGSVEPSTKFYFRPGGVDQYRRPNGIDLYLRP